MINNDRDWDERLVCTPAALEKLLDQQQARLRRDRALLELLRLGDSNSVLSGKWSEEHQFAGELHQSLQDWWETLSETERSASSRQLSSVVTTQRIALLRLIDGPMILADEAVASAVAAYDAGELGEVANEFARHEVFATAAHGAIDQLREALRG